MISTNTNSTNTKEVTVRKKTASERRSDDDEKKKAKRTLTPTTLAKKLRIGSKKDPLKGKFEKLEMQRQFLELSPREFLSALPSSDTSATVDMPGKPSPFVVSPPRVSPSEENSASKPGAQLDVSLSRVPLSAETSASMPGDPSSLVVSLSRASLSAETSASKDDK
jgi:hypothetical protein